MNGPSCPVSFRSLGPGCLGLRCTECWRASGTLLPQDDDGDPDDDE